VGEKTSFRGVGEGKEKTEMRSWEVAVYGAEVMTKQSNLIMIGVWDRETEV